MEGFFMNRFRNVKKDLIREWLDFREENNFGCVLSDEDKMHHICFEEISEVILSKVPKKDRKFVKRHLDMLDYNYTDYISYWNERYYRHGFCDALQLVDGHSEFLMQFKKR